MRDADVQLLPVQAAPCLLQQPVQVHANGQTVCRKMCVQIIGCSQAVRAWELGFVIHKALVACQAAVSLSCITSKASPDRLHASAH